MVKRLLMNTEAKLNCFEKTKERWIFIFYCA